MAEETREVERLRRALRLFKKPHWAGCYGLGRDNVCNCGAGAWNGRVERFIAGDCDELFRESEAYDVMEFLHRA